MMLTDLAERIHGDLTGDGAVEVADVTHDSRQAGPGTLFVAVRGLSSDGHDYVVDAADRGAAALCVEALASSIKTPVPQLVVPSTREALGPLASIVHGEPSTSTAVVGVTGTNGKTTVTHMVSSIVAASGGKPGLIGTVGGRIGDDPIELLRTTPEASDFQRLLAEMVDAEVNVVATEVSSHAMVLHRVAGTRFAVTAFTGLSQDHLDFHGDMDSYYRAKAELFTPAFSDWAVINVDDPAGARLADETDLEVLAVGEEIVARSVALGTNGSEFELVTPAGNAHVELPLGGRFNVSNALVAAGIATILGITPTAIAAGLGALSAIPGRMERIPDPGGRHVYVDYAHTPDGIEQVVASARQLTNGRIVAVVGAAGDRDRRKRPLMGRAAAAADLAIITSDNPRSEDPDTILPEVVAGIPTGNDYAVEVDRRAAIRLALVESSPGDAVLILGKGHETGQEFADGIVPFDDRAVAAEEIQAL